MVEAGLKRSHLREIADNPSLEFREGIEDLLETAQKARVPFHVFSAGIYDVIHEVFDFHNLHQVELWKIILYNCPFSINLIGRPSETPQVVL